jgi:diadenosine tetraphosphate (Ap4A) HIT family hydrolase
VPKLQDLTEVEAIDLFMTAHEVSLKLQSIHKVEYQIFSQNGKDSGQTVPHCHLHLIPKRPKDQPGLEREADKQRSEDDMAKEADSYRDCFEQGST